MDSRDRSPVQLQHMSHPPTLPDPETVLQSMPEEVTRNSALPTTDAMSTTIQEDVRVSAATVTAEADMPTSDPTQTTQQTSTEDQTRPAEVTTSVEETSDSRPLPTEQQNSEPSEETSDSRPLPAEQQTSEISAETQQVDSTMEQAAAQRPDVPEPPSEATPNEPPPVNTDSASAEEAQPGTETETAPPAETQPTDGPPADPPQDPQPTDEPAERPAEDSQPADPEPAPPPKPDIPEWVTWEDDLSTPTEEELEEVKDSEAETDATNVAAKEKQVFPDHDDPEQRPIKKIRLSWIIKGVRGTRERPNRARTMNSPPAYIDGLYWSIKFFPRGNKCSSVSAYIQCSREKPQPDKQVPESTFTYFEGPPDADLGQSAEPINRIKVEATPLVKPEEKQTVEENNKEASASNDNSTSEDEIKPAAETTLTEEEKDFRRPAQLGMVLYNPEEPRTATCHSSEHQFCPRNSDWGWTNFVGKWDEIHLRKRGERQPLLKNDTIGIDAYIRVFDDPTQALWWHGSHDNESTWPSKLLAGYFPMGTPPLYHSPAVAGITTWLLLAPFRQIIQQVDTSKWRSDSQVKPRPFIARLQAILHQMRHMKHEEYVNVHHAIETLRDYGETSSDVKTFWETFRRAIELELEGETEFLQKLAAVFDVSEQRYTLPSLPVRGVGDVQTALSMIQQPANLPASGPDVLPLMLEREAFDKISREWKMHHDRVTLNDDITLPFGDSTKYNLYGFVVHVGTRNSGRFYSILRPNGPGTKWLAFEDGDGNKVFSYSRKTIKEYEGLVGEELDNFTSTRQTAYMALYIKADLIKEYLPGKLEDYQAPKWLKKACDLDDPKDEDAREKNDETSPKADRVAFEVYHDKCAIGRQGLMDMFNVKQFCGNRGSFRSWALPSKTTIQDLREQLATSMDLDNPAQLRVFGMSFGEVGQYGHAMWNQLALNTTLGDLATDVRPLCLWTSTLETDDDVKLYRMPEPVPAEPAVEDESSDESGEEETSDPPQDIEQIAGNEEQPAASNVVPENTTEQPPARTDTQSAEESTPPAAEGGSPEPQVATDANDGSAETGPEQVQSGELTAEQPVESSEPETATSAPVESSEPETATSAPVESSGPETATSALVEASTDSQDHPTPSEPVVTEGLEPVQPQTQVPVDAAPDQPATSTESELAEPQVQPAGDSANDVTAQPDSDAAPTVTTDEPAQAAQETSDNTDTPLPVEHGHLVDAVLTTPEHTSGPVVVEQVVAVVAEAQAAPPQHETSAEDDAAIAAVIAADAAELSGESVQETASPEGESPANEANEASDTSPPAAPADADAPTGEAPERTPDESSTTATSPERQEPERLAPCTYGFIQLFNTELQSFTVHRTFFAGRNALVRATLRRLLDYEESKPFNVWYRTTTIDGMAVSDSDTFTDINFVDGVDLIVGEVLAEEKIAELRAQGKFWEPFALSKFLRMQERKHPQAVTTQEGEEVEMAEFGGQYYKGPLVNGRQHGSKCQIIYANGQTYLGPLTCNQRHGTAGTMTYQNGDVYEGEWAEDEQHGQGTFVQKRTGNKYVGGFLNGKRWGKGTTFWEVADEEADLCQICYGEEIDALFFDCGHVCSCVECAKQCESCPICRRSVRQVVKMYRV